MKPHGSVYLILAFILVLPSIAALGAPPILVPASNATKAGDARGPLGPTSTVPVSFAQEENTFSLSTNPTYRFVRRLADHPAAGPAEVGTYVHDLFHDLGHQVPPSDVDAVNESATLSFTYPLGDINGDGLDDVGFDVFCVDLDVCAEPMGLENTLYPVCFWRHWFEARSGKDGEILWTKPLDTPYPLPVWRLGCSLEFVIGTVPNEAGTRDILVYRWQYLYGFAAILFHHETYLMGNKEGEQKWIDKDDGVCTVGISNCVNVVIRPLLQTPPIQGNPILPEKTTSALFLRGIGFIFWYATCQPCLGPQVIDPLLDHYAPLEWAAGVDLATGDRLWEKDTFQPQPDRSLFPDTYPSSWLPFFEFFQTSCCWDQTGDGVPDLIYTTIEWSPIQATHATGPDTWDSHVVLFDGKTGDKIYAIETAKDLQSPFYMPWLVPLGDVDGDGAADYYHGQVIPGAAEDTVLITVRIYSGKEGKALWKLEGNKLFDVLVLGDADGDGGNDFLLATYELGRGGLALYNVNETHLVVHNGATGAILWETKTLAAGIDLAFMFFNARMNGLADLTGDKIGDIWLDRPIQLSDLTAIHNATFLSGRDGTPLFTVPSVGAFAFPIGAKDLDGDGGNDFTITQGDMVDMWITAHNGRTGDPLWSRRLMAIPTASAVQSIPILKYHSMELDGNATEADLLLSFTMYVVNLGGGRLTRSLYQQHQGIQGFVGRHQFAVPALDEEDPDVSLHIGEPTPATAQYTGWKQPTLEAVVDGSLLSTPVAVGMGATALLSLAGGFLVVRRRFLK